MPKLPITDRAAGAHCGAKTKTVNNSSSISGNAEYVSIAIISNHEAMEIHGPHFANLSFHAVFGGLFVVRSLAGLSIPAPFSHETFRNASFDRHDEAAPQ